MPSSRQELWKIFKNKKDMLQKLMLSMTALFAFTAVMAQPGERKEKLEALKRQYITTELELTVAEAEKFWPVFNEFETARKALRKSVKESSEKAMEPTASKEVVIESAETIARKKKEEADLELKFIKDVMPIVGPQRTARLFEMEEEFTRRLLEEMRDRRGEGGGGSPPQRRR